MARSRTTKATGSGCGGSQYLPAARRLGPLSAGGLMAAVEDIGDVVDAVGVVGGIAACSAQVGVAEAGGDAMDRYAVFEQRRRPIGPQGVRMREPRRHAGS